MAATQGDGVRRAASNVKSAFAGRGAGLRTGLVIFALALVAGLWFGTALLVQRDRHTAIESVTRANRQLARVFEEHTIRSLAEAGQLATVIRAQYLRLGKGFDLVRFFRDVQGERTLVQNVLIADASGQSVLNAMAGAPAINIADREHFKVHVARDTGEVFIGKPVQTISGKQWSLIVSLRINQPDGTFGGTVDIALDPAYFARLYDQIDLGPGGAVILIGLDGIVRARAAKEGGPIAGQNISGAEVFRQLEQRPAGSFTAVAKVDGVRRIQTYRKLPGYPLVVTVGVAEQVVLAGAEIQRNLYFLLAALLTALIGAATTGLYTVLARQQRAALTVQSAGARLIEAQELAGMLSLEWSIDGDRVNWSRAPAFLLGPQPPEGYPVYREMVHPEDRAVWLAERKAALEARTPALYSDYRLMRTDGSMRWISCTQRPAEMAGGVRRASFTLLDITARKEAETALGQSESRLRELTHNLEREVQERSGEIRAREALLHLVTENIPVMIGYFDAGFHLRFANTAFALHLGVKPDEAALGLHASRLFPPARQNLLRHYAEGALGGATQHFELPHRHDADRVTEVTLVPERLADGSAGGLFMVMTDITGRKQAERQLQNSVSLLTATLEATADGILVVRADRSIATFNQRYVQMWRLPPDLMQTHDHRLVLPHVLDQLADAQNVTAKVEALYADPIAESSDVLQCKDGRIFERYSRPQLVDGVAVGRVWSFRDVTERVRAEAALRAADERHSAIVANMIEGVIVRGRDGLIVDCNPSAERMFGVAREQMRGKPSPPCGWPASREDGTPVPDFQRAAHAALSSGKLQSNAVIAYRRPDGGVVWHLSNSQPLFQAGDPLPVGVFTTYTDISAHKAAEAAREALEAQLRESQKMEAMGTLAGGIAHDFNNILAAILGNVALARDDLGAAHAARQSIDEIGKAGERAKHLVQQILAFSRKQPQQFARVPMQGVVDETLAMLRATLPAGIRIEPRISAAPCVVHADATQMGQVLMNLCTNAWLAISDAGHAGMAGAIAVRLDEIELDSAAALRFGAVAPGTWVRLTVSDSGKGMDAATQARIFEPFFTTRQVGEGTGLGLSVAHGIVRSHGGAIAVSSAPGKGTVFEVILPALKAEAQGTAEAAARAAEAPGAPARAPASAPTGTPAGQHVLYLDDEPAMVLLVKRMLTKYGYRVSAFERPAEALAAVRADPGAFDLVVTDFNMPGKSGLDVTREIAQIRASLPVVIASGYITDELRAGAAQLGVRELIYKPNTLDELCQSIARVLQTAQD